MAIKRKLENVATVPEGIGASSKRPLSGENGATLTYTTSDIRTMPHEQLIEVSIDLNAGLAAARQQLKELQSARPLQETNGNRQKPQPTWTSEQVSEKAQQMRELSVKGIERQMKWQPSCKKGSTKWSFEAVAPNKDVFFRMFNFETNSKPFKLKVPAGEFQTLFGDVGASCRYNYLSITGENVNVHWNEDESTFRLSGTLAILALLMNEGMIESNACFMTGIPTPVSLPSHVTSRRFLLRLARVRLNVGSRSTGPAHLADHIGAVAQKSSLLQTVKFFRGPQNEALEGVPWRRTTARCLLDPARTSRVFMSVMVLARRLPALRQLKKSEGQGRIFEDRLEIRDRAAKGTGREKSSLGLKDTSEAPTCDAVDEESDQEPQDDMAEGGGDLGRW